MLDMQHWSKELVLSKYQELKKHLLKAFEKQLSIVNGELKDAKEGGDANLSGVEAILANLKIEIDKVYVRFEDEDLQFSMGWLVPHVMVIGTDEDYVPQE